MNINDDDKLTLWLFSYIFVDSRAVNNTMNHCYMEFRFDKQKQGVLMIYQSSNYVIVIIL